MVAPEYRCSPYAADDYSYSPSLEARIVSGLSGKVYGPYTGRCFSSSQDTDIEHIVARSEAHDSGLCAADAETKRRFAHNLLNLTLANPRVNRYEKRGKDAGGVAAELESVLVRRPHRRGPTQVRPHD